MKINELIMKAIKEDNLDKMLVGQEPYKCEISEFVAVEVPTDWPNIIRTIYNLYEEKPELLLKDEFEQSIKCICNKGAFELYCTVMVVFFQTINEERHIAPFKINRLIIFQDIRERLRLFEDELKSCKDWTGKKYQDGLWGDIRRVNSILYEDFGISII